MDHPQLRRGDRGEAVERLQGLLNRVGAMLSADGVFGSGTQRGVTYAQDQAGREPDGVADGPLWSWLERQPEPFPALATNGVALIAREETGGLGYFEQVTRWPHFPGESSGITIGVGYDLRFNSEADLRALWSPHLPAATIDELAKDIGKRGTKKRQRELKRRGIEVPFKAAWPVFIHRTMPRYYGQTEAIYPSLPRLPDLCRSVLVSIVFNRGGSLNGERRSEMRAIRDILAQADAAGLDKARRKQRLVAVEDQIVAMKRLWNPGSGLVKRRQAEANMWREGLDAW